MGSLTVDATVMSGNRLAVNGEKTRVFKLKLMSSCRCVRGRSFRNQASQPQPASATHLRAPRHTTQTHNTKHKSSQSTNMLGRNFQVKEIQKERKF